jgi:methyl-accepting chemotaxis protein
MQQHRRSIFLINRPFQLRFAFFVCSWLFALSLVYPLIIYNLFDFFARYLVRDPNGPGLASIESLRKEIIFLLIFFQVIFLVITFMISIFVSHRIAGPLYKLKNFFRQNGAGKLSSDLYFRKNDHFQDVAQEYNLMLSKLRAELRSVRETISITANELDGFAAGENVDSDQIKKLIANLHEASDKIPH